MKTFLLSLLILSLSLGSAQSQTSETLEKANNNYFQLARESVYLHTNKTTFIKGEDLYFEAYVTDRETHKLSLKTTTLYCFLYSGSGNLLDKKILYVNNGQASGNFTLKPNYEAGDLYVRAYTNWMRNFNGIDAYTTKLTLLGRKGEAQDEPSQSVSHPINFYPESGNFVTGIQTSMAFQVSRLGDEKFEVKKGRLIDSKDKVLKENIVINQFGFGKFSFIPRENLRYRLELELSNGNKIEEILPQASEDGVNMSVNTLLSDKLSISLSLSPSLFNKMNQKSYYLALHRDKHFVVSEVNFKSLQIQLQISKHDLLPGINIITLFNPKLQPIAERLVFNDFKIEESLLPTQQISGIKSKDSVSLNIAIVEKDSSFSNLSVSVLPAGSLANKDHRSIVSAFLLEPYLKGQIENPQYYFSDLNRNKLFELDLMLMVQGWSKYDWETIMNNPPELLHEHEKGITIHGKIMDEENTIRNSLAILPNDLNNLQLTDVDPDHSFVFRDSYIYKDEEMQLTLFDQKGEGNEPKISAKFTPFSILDENFNLDELEFFKQKSYNFKVQPKAIATLPLDKRTTMLDSVFLNAKKPKQELTQNLMLQNGIWEGVKMDVDKVKKNISLSNFLRKIGYRVYISDTLSGFINIKAKSRVQSDPILYIDGFKTENPIRDNLLQTVDEIYYEHMGTHGGNGGTIYIYRKYGSLVGDDLLVKYAKLIAKEGFDRPKTYYQPNYSSLTRKDFLEYGSIDWKSSLTTAQNGKVSFSFPYQDLTEYLVYIEGIDNHGRLISESQVVKIESP